MLIADIFVTTKNRPELLKRSLDSLQTCTDKKLYRLTVVRDGDYMNSRAECYRDGIDYVLVNNQNAGLGPSINMALAHIDVLNRYFSDPKAGDPEQVAPLICYCQDDLLYSDGWLEKLTKLFTMFEKTEKLGFASGVECVEHKVKKGLGNSIFLKDWIRAAQMLARREYWMSMFPIPRFDPETQRVRAKPNDGVGSGVDWHFIRNHENSVCKTGRTCLVVPGLVKHMGYKESTWLKRELPESDADKLAIAEAK